MAVEQRPAMFRDTGSEEYRGKLLRNVLLILLPITLIPVTLMGGAAYTRARSLLLQQVTSQLVLFKDDVSSTLSSWAREKNTRLGNVSRNADFRSAAFSLLDAPLNSPDYQAARISVLESLDAINPSVQNAVFDQFFFMDANGVILAATVPEWENLNINNTDIFSNNINEQATGSFTAISPEPLYTTQADEVLVDVEITNPNINRKPIMFSSRSISDENGNIVGYVVGVSESLAIQRLLQDNLSTLPSSAVYFHDLSLGAMDTAGWSGITIVHGLSAIDPSEEQITLTQTGQFRAGGLASTYASFDGLAVVGLYSEVPETQMGLLFEVPESNVFQQVNSLAPFTIILIAITGVLLALIISWGVRSLVRPILEVVEASQHFTDGDWQRRANVTRKDELGLLARSFNSMADELSNMYRSLEFEVAERTRQILTAAEVGHVATSASTLDELLRASVDLIVERFDLYHAAIFLLDEAKENAVLEEATGQAGQNLKAQNYRIPLTSNSIVTWVANNNRPRVSLNTQTDIVHMRHELLPETLSEAGIPLSIGTNVLGVLDVQSTKADAFDEGKVEVLSTLANQLSSAVQNYRLVEGTEIDLQQISQLYRASRRIAKAGTEDDVFRAAVQAVQNTSFISAIYVPRESQLMLVEAQDSPASYAERLPRSLRLTDLQTLSYLPNGETLLLRDIENPSTPLHSELLLMPQRLGCAAAAYLPILQGKRLAGLIILGSRDRGLLSATAIQPFSALAELVSTALEKVVALQSSEHRIAELQVLNDFSQAVTDENRPAALYPLIHRQIQRIFGDVHFYIALYDEDTDHIEIPYIYEGGAPIHVDPFPLGEGLTSIVIRTRQPLMLVEDTEARSRALGAKVVGDTAKSWMGVPLISAGNIVGVITVQDTEREHRFDDDDLRLMSTLASQVAGLINGARLLEETRQRAVQLQTSAEIAREISATLDIDELLNKAVNLVRDRFSFYHASVFLLEPSGEDAVIRESTGEAGRQMKEAKHSLKVGSKSIVGFATAMGEPLVVNDVAQDPTHRFNPLLPDTRAELGIPLKVGERVLGALDVQSTQPYAFSPADIEVLQTMADLLAVAVSNAELFTEIQGNLAQHRLVHHVTTVAASSTSLDDALSSAVQGLRVTLGDRVAIMLADQDGKTIQVQAAAGYEDEVLGLQVEIGSGITGWVAENREALMIDDVLKDPRYIAGSENVRSEIAVPLVYRGQLLGVLNVESDTVKAFSAHDMDILETLAGSLAAIIVNTRLSERQRQLFDVTEKIRRSVSMETIMETTASELSKALHARRARIEIKPQTNGDDSNGN